jgi:single-strand DNA-binding protein
MSSATTTTITGNLTRDPEIRYTRDGQATTSLGVAVNRRWQNRETNEWEESTSFFDVATWRELAENVALSLITRCSGRQHPKRPGYLLCGHVR